MCIIHKSWCDVHDTYDMRDIHVTSHIDHRRVHVCVVCRANRSQMLNPCEGKHRLYLDRLLGKLNLRPLLVLFCPGYSCLLLSSFCLIARLSLGISPLQCLHPLLGILQLCPFLLCLLLYKAQLVLDFCKLVGWLCPEPPAAPSPDAASLVQVHPEAELPVAGTSLAGGLQLLR